MNKNEIKQLLNNKEAPIIFEIGCADGGDTQDFVNTFPNGLFYCFEPEPKNIAIIKNRINHKNFNLFEGAVSDVDGELIFHRSSTDNPSDLSYSGSIKKPKLHLAEWPSIKFNNDVSVNSTTIDFFCEVNSIKNIDFIWMDVQGAEFEVLNGGKKMLKNTNYLYTEYSNREYYFGQKNLQDIQNILGEDWELVTDFSTDALFRNKKYDSNRTV
jgi:FkbM family methyltransferase